MSDRRCNGGSPRFDSAASLSQVMQILGYPVAIAHDGVERTLEQVQQRINAILRR
jgi:hypothetical protein